MKPYPKNNKLKYIFLIVTTFSLYQCTFIKSDSVEQFSLNTELDHTSHYGLILDEMGPPSEISRLGSGMVWLYEDVDVHEKQFGLGFNYNWLSLFKLNVASAKGFRKGLILTFDHNGFVTSLAKISQEKKIGGGVGFQFIFVVSSLVDVDSLTGLKSQEYWGQSLLFDLPRSINSNSDLESGLNGLEQLDTPSSVGQHTLNSGID